jgi:uncharacterized membrane protein YfcA
MRTPSWLNGNWSEEKQGTWAWGFFLGFLAGNLGFGIGLIIVKLLNYMGV